MDKRDAKYNMNINLNQINIREQSHWCGAGNGMRLRCCAGVRENTVYTDET